METLHGGTAHGNTATQDAASAPAPPAGGRAVLAEGTVVAAIAGVVYALSLSATPALTHDGPGYLGAIQAGGNALYHPHHLAYNVVARGWLDLWQALGVDADAFRIVEALNAVFGATAAALVWVILRWRAQLTRPVAAAGTVGAGLSYGFWFYSVSVEVYLLPLMLLLAAFLVLTTPTPSVRMLAVVGLINGLAVVAHQVNVLFAAVVVAVTVRDVDRRAVLRRLGAYGAAAGAAALGAYAAVLALAIKPRSVGDTTDWVSTYAQQEGYWYVGPSAPVRAVVGFARSIVGGHFAYRLGAVHDRVASSFPGKSLDDETFLVRGLSAALAIALVAVATLGLVALGGALVRGVRRRRDLPPAPAALLRPLVVWLAVYSAFFLVWEPINPEFWIPQATVVWMLVTVLSAPRAAGSAIGVAADRPPRGAGWRAVAVAAGCVAIANLLGTIAPARDSANDLYAIRYRAIAAEVEDGDLLVIDHPNIGLGYAARFAPDAEAMAAFPFDYDASEDAERDTGPAVLEAVLRTLAAGGTVAIDADLVQRPTGRAAPTGDAISESLGGTWRRLPVPGASDWYLVDP